MSKSGLKAVGIFWAQIATIALSVYLINYLATKLGPAIFFSILGLIVAFLISLVVYVHNDL